MRTPAYWRSPCWSLPSSAIGSAIVLLPVIVWIWATKDFGVGALPLTAYLLVVGFADVVKPML